MTEVEEPQFTSLAARKAALMQNGVGTGFGKRPPPPPPDKKPRMPQRSQTSNNPPIATYGSSAIQKPNNQPMNSKGQALLPPPPVDRDQRTSTSKTPPLPARNGPPALPIRKASQPSPALPPRKTSTQLVRRGSNDSTLSFSSTISGMSLGQSTTASSIDSGRRLPPALGEAKLPPLPPSRRELEEKAKAAKLPLVSTKSAPHVPLREPPVVDRDKPKTPLRPNGLPALPMRQSTADSLISSLQPPKMPPRPTSSDRQDETPALPPRMPPRPGNRQEEEVPPSQPSRRLPPPAAARSVLLMGFNNKNETPNPPPRPVPTATKSTGPSVLELSTSNFDRTIRGKKALVEFYGPRCWNCQQLEPHWQKLGENFAFASDRLIIAKVNMEANSMYHNRYGISKYPTILLFDGDGDTYDKYEGEWNLEELTEYLERKTGIRAGDGARAVSNDVPPPINLSSKPSSSQSRPTQAHRPAVPKSSGCLLCRDFSGPDGVAAQYPRQNLPRTHDITGYLADVLCGPFSSYTDKARAIFTWLHHNIAYDVDAFFNKTVKHTEPKDNIASGLAVCGGYAGVFSAIALKAGLEAVTVTGHGKGYGYNAMKPGDPIPPRDPTGHAWNAVRIDGGEWKLLDACWGAGNVAERVYNKQFTPSYFVMSNEEFGIKHFPQDDAYFFRADGSIPTWESYMLGPTQEEPLRIFGAAEDSGISPRSFEPPQRRIKVNSGETIRFQFHRVCEHWNHEKHGKGKPYCLILKIGGLNGKKDDFVAFESNEYWWWADVNSRDLGAPGQTVSVYSVTSVNNKDARGMTREEYLQRKGKPGSMGFGGICEWELV